MTTWYDAIPFFSSDKFPIIVDRILKECNTLPPKENWLAAFALTPIEHVKVVILGQDPYPTKGIANGLAFSVSPGIPLPRSLINIFAELKTDVGVERKNGDLSDWAKQGVLLLNTSLTVAEGRPGSHSDYGWGTLTTQVIRTLNETKENLVFILWGKHAQNKGACIDTNRHCVLKSAHPSPLSAHAGFFGSKPFSKTNQFLIGKQITPISW